MARPGLFTHRKFRRLSAMLGGEAIALGHLEFLWHTAYDAADPYVGDPTDVEVAARWTGEPGKLWRALLICGGEGQPGFIEEVENRGGHFAVHDLWDHAPRYVRQRQQRQTNWKHESENGARAASKTTVSAHSERRTAPVERSADAARRPKPPKRAPSAQDSSAQDSSAQEEILSVTAPTTRGDQVGAPDPPDDAPWTWAELFDRFWAVYPRKVAKKAARKAWDALAPKKPDDVMPRARAIASVLGERMHGDWAARPPDKIPHPATFLRAEAFDA